MLYPVKHIPCCILYSLLVFSAIVFQYLLLSFYCKILSSHDCRVYFFVDSKKIFYVFKSSLLICVSLLMDWDHVKGPYWMTYLSNIIILLLLYYFVEHLLIKYSGNIYLFSVLFLDFFLNLLDLLSTVLFRLKYAFQYLCKRWFIGCKSLKLFLSWIFFPFWVWQIVFGGIIVWISTCGHS